MDVTKLILSEFNKVGNFRNLDDVFDENGISDIEIFRNTIIECLHNAHSEGYNEAHSEALAEINKNYHPNNLM